MKKYSCPSCGAEVPFASAASVFAVCAFCKSMVVRRDLDLELLGKQAQLPPDQSPLQIGTGGSFRGTGFTLQGRFRMKWEGGFWNEWFAWCNDGRVAWLAEAQGFLSFYFAVEGEKFPPPDKLGVGSTISIAGQPYHIDDVKEAEVVASEGELPFRAAAGRKSTSMDANGDEGRTATLEFSEDGQRVYAGWYCEFDDFKFSNLRQIDGW